MRQIWIRKAGAPDVLQLQEAPARAPRNGEVRLRVEFCGVNFADVLGRMGLYPDAPPRPFVPGYEVSGVIDAVGQGPTDLKEGDRVFAFTPFYGYADVVTVPTKLVFRRLDWMSAEHAAALPVSYLSAFAMLVVMGSLRAGDKLLIHAAAGGLGLACLDIARIIGARTFGTASPQKHSFLLERGLHHPIDYRNHDYRRVIKDLTAGTGMQLIIDSLGGEHWRRNYDLLAPTGRLVCCGMSSAAPGQRRNVPALLRALAYRPSYSPLKLMNDNRGVLGFNLNHMIQSSDRLQAWMKQIVSWYDEALFRPHIDRIFRLEDAAEAHTYIQERRNVGKVLLKV